MEEISEIRDNDFCKIPNCSKFWEKQIIGLVYNRLCEKHYQEINLMIENFMNKT